MAMVDPQPSGADAERRLRSLGLSTALIHDGLRRGAERAARRSSHALKTAAGTDIYQDGMEDFARLLAPQGWHLVQVEGQPRLLHPDGVCTFTIAAGTNVGGFDQRDQPCTRRKGKATWHSVARRPAEPSLFGEHDPAGDTRLDAQAASAPFYFLLCERTTRGVRLELARPVGMTEGGSVNVWDDRIRVDFLPLEEDLSVFDPPHDDGAGDLDVPVVPR